MPYIIVEPCVGTCDTACVDVCPVDCIHGPYDKEGSGEEAKADGFVPKETDSLYIDPEEWNKYIKLNYDFFGREMN